MSERLCADPPVRAAVETSEHPIFFQNAGFDMLARLREDFAFDTCWRTARLFPLGRPFPTEQHTYQAYAARPDRLRARSST